MARNYYSLVAGLREYALETDNKGFDAKAIIEEIRVDLSKKDKASLDLFYTYYDIENIINIIAGRTQFSTLGNFTRSELEHEIKSPAGLPGYIAGILIAYADPENPEFDEIDKEKAIEKSLFGAYYSVCGKSKCRFIKNWYEFDRNLRNVTAAYTAKRLGIAPADVVVGGGYVTDLLSRSSAADFGLKGELDYIDRIMAAVAEEGNLLEKEHAIDLIRWEMADALTAFDYFNINTILAYLVKVNIVHRWATLDPAIGREMFRKLMASFSGEEMLERTAEEN